MLKFLVQLIPIAVGSTFLTINANALQIPISKPTHPGETFLSCTITDNKGNLITDKSSLDVVQIDTYHVQAEDFTCGKEVLAPILNQVYFTLKNHEEGAYVKIVSNNSANQVTCTETKGKNRDPWGKSGGFCPIKKH